MNQEEIYFPDNLEQGEEGYTYERVLNEVCKGNEILAKVIWAFKGGAFPETMIDEWKGEGEIVEYNDRYYFVYSDEQYNDLCSLNDSSEGYKEAILIANEFREEEGLFVNENCEIPNFKKQYRDLEMSVLSALRDKITKSNDESEFIQGKCIKIDTAEFCEIAIVHDRIKLIDALGYHYDWSEISLEVLIDILEE